MLARKPQSAGLVGVLRLVAASLRSRPVRNSSRDNSSTHLHPDTSAFLSSLPCSPRLVVVRCRSSVVARWSARKALTRRSARPSTSSDHQRQSTRAGQTDREKEPWEVGMGAGCGLASVTPVRRVGRQRERRQSARQEGRSADRHTGTHTRTNDDQPTRRARWPRDRRCTAAASNSSYELAEGRRQRPLHAANGRGPELSQRH